MTKSLEPVSKDASSTPLNHDRLIETHSFAITGFFHMTCFLVMLKKPFISTSSNTHKIEGLLRDIGIPDRLLGIKDIVQNADVRAFSKEEEIRIEYYLEQAPTKINSMFSEIREYTLKYLEDRSVP